MSSTSAVIRVQRDLREVHDRFGNSSDCPPIFAMPADGGESLSRIVALVVGPPDTPYDGGFFFFDVSFPPSYPNEPPGVRIVSTDFGGVRFNPNLYASGKVCLSILGTWSGERGGSENWRSSYSLGYVLQCIQCMIMNSEPYHNEPGFDMESLSRLGTKGGPSHNFGFAASPQAVLSALVADMQPPAAAAGAPAAANATSDLSGPVGDDPLNAPGSPSGISSTGPSLGASPIPHQQAGKEDSESPQPPGASSSKHGDADFPSPTATPPTVGAATSTVVDVTLDQEDELGGTSVSAMGAAPQNKSVSPESFFQPQDMASPMMTTVGPMSPLAGPTSGAAAPLHSAAPAAAEALPLPVPVPGQQVVTTHRRAAAVVSPEQAERMRAGVRAAAEAYRLKIHHETLRHTVCDLLEGLLGLPRSVVPSPHGTAPQREVPAAAATDESPEVLLSHAQCIPAAVPFEAEVKRQFLMRYETYLEGVASPPLRHAHHALITKHPGTPAACYNGPSHVAAPVTHTTPKEAAAQPYCDGEQFARMPFEGGDNQCRGYFNYAWLASRLQRIRTALDTETEHWKQLGEAATLAKDARYHSMLQELESASAIACVCGAPVNASRNVFLWEVTIMPHEGLFDGTAYVIEIVFHPENAAPPRARFRQPILHPNVSKSGVPFTGADDCRNGHKRWSASSTVSAVAKLLLTDAGLVNNAGSILNRDAAADAFSADPERAKKFRRDARRLARRTVEE